MKRIFLALTIILALGAGYYFYQNRTPTSSSTATTSINVGFAPVVLNIPLYLAQDQKIFASHGVTVEAKSFSSANDMVNAIVAGQVDVVTGVSMVPVLNLEAQFPGKVRIVLHSRMTAENPYDGIIVKGDSSIKTLADLTGKKIGVYPGTTATNLLRGFLKKQGMDPQAVTPVPLPPPSHLSALDSGAVDALLAYEPTLTTALQQSGARQVFGSIFVSLLSPSPIAVTIISRDFESKHPAAAKAFIASLDEAVSKVQADVVAAKQTLPGHTKVTAEIAPKVNAVPDVLSTAVDEVNVQQFMDLMVELGELPKPLKAAALLK